MAAALKRPPGVPARLGEPPSRGYPNRATTRPAVSKMGRTTQPVNSSLPAPRPLQSPRLLSASRTSLSAREDVLDRPGGESNAVAFEEPHILHPPLGQPLPGLGGVPKSRPVDIVDAGEEPEVGFAAVTHRFSPPGQRNTRTREAFPLARTILTHDWASFDAPERMR